MRKCSVSVVLLLTAALLAIVGYNIYAVRSGACPCQEFWSPMMLIIAAALLLLAGLVIWLMFCRQPDVARCPHCRRSCRSEWKHCPDCGAALAHGAEENSR